MSVIEVSAEAVRAAELRDGLTDELVADSAIVSEEVEAAFRAVPRHLFVPDAPLEEAYARDIVAAKRDEHGTTISSVSAPQIQAMMLEQAGIGAGMRVLEVGSGGYNAALIAELVGGSGEVTTIDIDPEVIDRARGGLARAGYPRVNVALADGEDGCAHHAPYDRVIVTAGAWDIAPAWVDQLTEDGTLTVPLRMRGLTRSVTFAPRAGHLLSRSAEICGFVKMQGAGAHTERLLLVHGAEIGLRFDDEGPAEAELLNGALGTPRVEAWSGVRIGTGEPFGTLQMWLATALDGFCLLAVDPALDSGLVSPQNRRSCPAVAEGGSFAYLALRAVSEEGAAESEFEFGAHAFGPDAARLAEELAALVGVWGRAHRGGQGPSITAYPAHTPDEELPEGRVITKRHVRVILSWPSTGRTPAGQGALHHPTGKE